MKIKSFVEKEDLRFISKMNVLQDLVDPNAGSALQVSVRVSIGIPVLGIILVEKRDVGIVLNRISFLTLVIC